MQAIKTAAVWIEDGVFAVVFLSHCGAFGSSTESPPAPGICHPRQKENANARGSDRGGGWVGGRGGGGDGCSGN